MLMPKYIPKRNNELSDVVAEHNEPQGFLICGGAVDRSHMAHFHTVSYYKAKGWYSVVLRPLVDDQVPLYGCVVHVQYVGWPGRVHDAGVFAN